MSIADEWYYDVGVDTVKDNTEKTEPPTLPPTDETGFVASTDTPIIKETFRVYGSMYAVFFVFFCIARVKLQKWYNIRSWVPEMKCGLAQTQQYGWISWCWQVFKVSDDELLDNCGMDALCFIRCLRFGAKLSLWGSVNALWLIPLYLTAEDSPETEKLKDPFVLMSVSNLPPNSPRFAALVVSAYVIFLVSLYLIAKEYEWFIEYRHKFLSKRNARNYSIYVSGIPRKHRSSYGLKEYFEKCSMKDAVMEAHIAVDVPSLDSKVARRDKVLEKLEHAIALERKHGTVQTHIKFRLRRKTLKKVESVAEFRDELETLNREIEQEVRHIQRQNDRMRHNFTKSRSDNNISDITMRDGSGNTLLNGVSMYSSKSQKSIYNWVSDKTAESSVSDVDPKLVGSQHIFRATSSVANSIQTANTSSSETMALGAKQHGLAPIKENPDSLPTSPIGSRMEQVDPLEHLEHGEAHQVDFDEHEIKDQVLDDTSVSSLGSEERNEKAFLSMFGFDPNLFLPVRESPEGGSTTHSGITTEESSKESANYANKELRFALPETEIGGNKPELSEEGGIGDGSSQLSESNPDYGSEYQSSAMSRGSEYQSSEQGSQKSNFSEDLVQGLRDAGSKTKRSVKRATKLTKEQIMSLHPDNLKSTVKKAKKATKGSIGTAVDFGKQTIQKAPDLGLTIAQGAASVVPMRININTTEGQPRDAGFVVFNNLYTRQAAIQMTHHQDISKIQVFPAPAPDEVFWKNVGLKYKARRSGWLLSMVASTALCCFWAIPSAFLSSMTEVNSLKENLPTLEKWIEEWPPLENLLALVAPLFLLLLNELFLPVILKWFATWEGHVSESVLEASLFVKLCAFTIIQTFIVSAISGSISAELTNIINNPEEIAGLLANSLPAQSSYFIQICFAFTFLMQGFDLIRAYPLGLAFARRYFFGPNLTAKERRKSWGMFSSLEDPPRFWHAEILAQVVLFFVVYFVYASLAPITSVFLFFCFVICESGYRYHFIHNQHPKPDSGGKLWQGFTKVLLGSIMLGEITICGLLILKNTVYALPAMIPLMIFTLIYYFMVVPKRELVANFLPTSTCMEADEQNSSQENRTATWAAGEYLQPSLKAEKADYDDDWSLASSMSKRSRSNGGL